MKRCKSLNVPRIAKHFCFDCEKTGVLKDFIKLDYKEDKDGYYGEKEDWHCTKCGAEW